MNPPDATLTNGRNELPASGRGMLVLADPPEAGWRIQAHSNTPVTNGALTSQHGRERDGRHPCGTESS